jgi:hypothetical protein
VACLEYYSGSGLWPAGVLRGFDIDEVDVFIIDNLRMMEDVPIMCGRPLFGRCGEDTKSPSWREKV